MTKNLHSLSAIFLLFLCCLYNSPIIAQAPAIEWEQNYGGSANDATNDIQQTVDGGYILAGYSSSNDGDVSGNQGGPDYWVVKLDESGVLVWQKTLGGTGYDVAHSVQQTADGGYIVAGFSNSNDGDVSGNHGDFDYWIVKLDSNGSLIWQKSLGGTGDDRAYSIQQTADGGFIVAGESDSNNGDVSGNNGLTDFWVVKLDENGVLVWQKSLGGTGYDVAHSVQQTADGGYIVAGESDSNNGDVSGNNGLDDIWVVKLDENGMLIWQKSLGGSIGERALSIQETIDGGYIVVGYSNSNDGDVSENFGGDDMWVVKLDNNGVLVLQKALGGSSLDSAHSIQQTTDWGYIIAGQTYSNDGLVSVNNGEVDYWVVKLDDIGTLLWEKALGGTSKDVATSIWQTLDGGYIVAGYSDSIDGDLSGNYGNIDFWIVKLHCDQPTPPTLPDQEVCDNNPAYIFDLTQSTQGVAAGLIVSYYPTQQDAEDNTNAIVDPENFEIPGGTQIIYVRIDNGNCHEVGSFVIEVVTCPLPDATIVIDVVPSLCYGQETNMEV
ncbi:MAG: hypothetical protein WD554_04410, partial [Flavobacteriaceae bacterium]